MDEKQPCVYIITNTYHGTLYTGVTSNLIQRIWHHKNKTYGGFSAKHGLSILVYYQIYDTMDTAIIYEKKIKGGSRAKKIALIENHNPCWNDLYDGLF